ncbi:MAG: PAS domain S-box protein, partial [Alphaproteobacteria bacterium]|nr:PAS domain S-box protein [Alphaproteobacteria bacterium]
MSSAQPETNEISMDARASVSDLFGPLAAAYSHLEDSAVIFSAEGEIVLWNLGAEKLYGYSFEEAARKDISFLAPPEDSGDTIKLFARALSGQPVAPRQVERIRKDGTRVRISLRATPLEDENGAIFGVLFLGRDLTPELDREIRLTELQRREREIARLVPDAVYVHRNGKILWANDAAVEMFSAQSLTDLIGRSAWDLIVKEDLERVLHAFDELAEGNGQLSIYVARMRLNGEVFPSEARGAQIQWEDEPATLMVIRDVTEQERAIRELAESETRQRDFANISPDAMIVHLDGEIVFVNDAAISMYGAESSADLVGRDASDFIHPDDREFLVGNWTKWRRGEGHDVMLVRRLRLDGSSFHGEGRFRAVTWQGQDAYLVTIRDVSDQIRNRKALEESEERHRQMIEISPDSILVQVNDRIVFANKAALEMYGVSSENQLLGRDSMDLVPDDLHEFVRERRKSISREGTAPLVEVRRRRLDGTEFFAEVTGCSYTWDGAPAVLTIGRDITERVEAERARAALEERYRKILELTPEATFVHAGGKIRFVNPAAVEMFGAESEDELLGREIIDFVHPDDREMIERQRESVREGATMQMSDVRRLRVDG